MITRPIFHANLNSLVEGYFIVSLVPILTTSHKIEILGDTELRFADRPNPNIDLHHFL